MHLGGEGHFESRQTLIEMHMYMCVLLMFSNRNLPSLLLAIKNSALKEHGEFVVMKFTVTVT